MYSAQFESESDADNFVPRFLSAPGAVCPGSPAPAMFWCPRTEIIIMYPMHPSPEGSEDTPNLQKVTIQAEADL